MKPKSLVAGTIQGCTDSSGFYYVFRPKCDIYLPTEFGWNERWNLGDIRPSLEGMPFLIREKSSSEIDSLRSPKTPEDFQKLIGLAEFIEGKESALKRILEGSYLGIRIGYIKESTLDIWEGIEPIKFYTSAATLVSFPANRNYKKE